MGRVYVAYMVGALGLGLIACNGEDDTPYRSGIASCGEFAACGGDLVGTWQVQSVCSDDLASALSMSLDEPTCDNVLRSTQIAASGSYVFGSDGNVTRTLSLTMDAHLVWTAACLAALSDEPLDAMEACGDINDGYMRRPGYVDVSCVFDGSACDCMISRVGEIEATESYRATSTEILDPDDPPAQYCVADDTLTLVEHNDDADLMIRLTRAN